MSIVVNSPTLQHYKIDNGHLVKSMSDSQTNMEYLPGWTAIIDEISNGVFKVTLRDSYGHLAELTDIATDETISRAVGCAFDIEKQISKNWGLFLFEFALILLPESKVTNKMYDDNAFGSWYIEMNDESRVVYDGKEGWLFSQRCRNFEWMDQITLKQNELIYSNFTSLINRGRD